MIKVLWIDDQHDDKEMVQFAIDADNEGLILEGYPSFEEGFDVLERNLEYFDIILLDGLFFEKKGQEAGTEDETGIGMAIAKINELKSRKVFPWFVLSGKDKFTKGENSLLKANKAKCFDKTNPYEVVKLFEEMKIAAKLQTDFQLKFKYAELLETCTDDFIGTEHFTRILALVKYVENTEKLANTEDMLNPIRKIIERIFTRMAEFGIIPDTIISNKGWINGSSLFLADKHPEYNHLKEITPPLISENIHRLLNILQDASHSEGELKLKVDHYLKNANSDYLFRSCIYLLFDLLVWFKDYLEMNPDEGTNKTRWKSKVIIENWITGKIIKIDVNHWGTFQPENTTENIRIPPKMVDKYQLKENDSINIITKLSPCGTKKHIKAIKNYEPSIN